MSNLTIEILEQLDPPEHCPFTGLPFFMWIEHHATKKWVPTYGGPNDSYTIPKKDENGCFVRERYDHDFGGWVVGEVEDVGMQVVDDQSIVLEPSHPSYDWLNEMQACNPVPKVLGWQRAADDDEHMLDPLFFLGELKPTIVTARPMSTTVQMPALPRSVHDVAAERLRQIRKKGYTPAHDLNYHDGQLVHAAVCYSLASRREVTKGCKPGLWPWGSDSWKPSYGRTDLVKAAALLLAEIDRLDGVAELYT